MSAATLFREVHRLRKQASDLQGQLDRIPRQLKAQKARVERHEADLHDMQEQVRKLKVTAHEKEVTLKTRHGQIARYEKQTNDVSSKKEFDALRTEIATAKEECKQLEDDILSAMLETDEKTALLPGLEKALQQVREECAAFEKEAAARKTDLAAKVAALRKEIQAVEAGVPADLRETYNRIVTAKDAEAFSEVRGQDCTACNTEIPGQTLSNLHTGVFTVCRSCGRILYFAEEPAEPDEL